MNKIEELSKFAKNFNYGNILNDLLADFGYLYSKDEIDYIALHLQISIKPSKPNYIHGYVLTSALFKYVKDHSNLDICILETGTARGFSSIIMATVLDEFRVNGCIYTLDNVNTFDKCYLSCKLNRKISLNECIQPWNDVSNKYINFINGNSRERMKHLKSKFERIHFAFLDGSHDYDDVKYELDYVNNKQLSGDVIVCDDYTPTQFPGICQAIDEFLVKKQYESKIYYSDDGEKNRGYVYMKKI